MAKKYLLDITKDENSRYLNLGFDREVRHGYVKKYASGEVAGYECVAMATLSYTGATTWPSDNSTVAVVTAWSNGKIMVDSVLAHTLTASTDYTAARWMKLLPVTVSGWYATGTAWRPKNVLVLYTDKKNFIIDPTAPVGGAKVYDIARTTPSAPTLGSPSGGIIPAGTYNFVVTEVSYHGIETLVSASASVTSATDFQVVATKPATANTDSLRWRLYMYKVGSVAMDATYRLVAEAGIATTTITANLLPSSLGFKYNNARLALPAKCKTGTVHQGVLVSAGNEQEPTTIYVGSATNNEETGTEIAGFPEVGHVVATYEEPKQLAVVALESMNGVLLAFTHHSITAYYGDLQTGNNAQSRVISDNIGTLSDRTVARCGNMLFFTNHDGSRAFATDGVEVQDITDHQNLLQGLFYALAGNQEIGYREKLQGKFTAQVVIADPQHNVVMFGGEIVTDSYYAATYAGTWNAAATAANPQGNRQYVWRVFHVNKPAWATWTNIPVKSYCVKQGIVWFSDHLGNVWQMNEDSAKDGAVTGVLVTKSLTASTGSATITLNGGWTGVVTAGTPVMLFNVSTGVTQMFYAVSGTPSTVTVDRNATVTANDILIVGVPVVEVWQDPVTLPIMLHSIEWMLLPDSSDGRVAVIAQMKTKASASTWTNIIRWVPQGSTTRNRVPVGTYCPSLMLRFLLPAVNQNSTAIEDYSNITVKTIRLHGEAVEEGMW